MKKLIFLLSILFFSSHAFRANADFRNETLNYVVSYKWGLIHKDAGSAVVNLRNDGAFYDIRLTARTKPWADRIYHVRDTLLSRIEKNGFRPRQYTKIAHEGGKYGRDQITFSYSGSSVRGHCIRYREKKDRISRSEKILNASREAFDFLSVFYYLRKLDFARQTAGSVIRTTVFSGSKAETLTVKFHGLQKVKMKNGTTKEAYHVRFNFTMKGKKKSSDDIDAWISDDSRHIPLLLIGRLPVGQIKCYYVG